MAIRRNLKCLAARALRPVIVSTYDWKVQEHAGLTGRLVPRAVHYLTRHGDKDTTQRSARAGLPEDRAPSAAFSNRK